MNTHRNTVAALALAALTGAAHASVTSYDNRGDFDLATGLQTIETFEASDLGSIAMPAAFGSGLGADLFNGAVSSFIEAGDPDGFGFENTTAGGRKYLRFGENIPGGPDQTGSYSVDFTFGGSVRAFGFDISGFQPSGGADGFNLSLFSGNVLVYDLFVPADVDFTATFFGFTTDTSFDTARVNLPVIGSAGAADYVAFDDVTWSAVPTPGAASLLALAGLTAARRRR